MQRFELHTSQISDDFVYWFRNGEDTFQAVLRKKSLKMSVLYWRVPYIYPPLDALHIFPYSLVFYEGIFCVDGQPFADHAEFF